MSVAAPSLALQSLADVELQSVMHFLSSAELIKLARCSQRMMKLADSPFAWKHTLLPISRTSLAASSFLSCRFLRIAPVSLRLKSKESLSGSEAHAAAQVVLRLLDAVPDMRLQAIDARKWNCPHGFVWGMILAHPACARHLRTLLMHDRGKTTSTGSASGGRVDEATLRLLASGLPNLQTLQINLADLRLPVAVWDDLAAAAAQSLKSLSTMHLEESDSETPGSSIHEVVRLAGSSLTNLTLVAPLIYGADFAKFFVGRSFTSRLQVLKLRGFHAKGIELMGRLAVPAEDYRSAFGALTSLHSLSLSRCYDVDVLLEHAAAAAPTLRVLVVEPNCASWHARTTTMPSLEALAQLMVQAAPKLSVKLRLKVERITQHATEYEYIAELVRRFMDDPRLAELAAAKRFKVQADLQ